MCLAFQRGREFLGELRRAAERGCMLIRSQLCFKSCVQWQPGTEEEGQEKGGKEMKDWRRGGFR